MIVDSSTKDLIEMNESSDRMTLELLLDFQCRKCNKESTDAVPLHLILNRGQYAMHCKRCGRSTFVDFEQECRVVERHL